MVEAMHGRRAGAKAIFDRLRLEHPDFPGSLSAVKRMCARLSRERGIAPDKVAIPVETEAGHIAQVDFSYVGKLYDPEQGVRASRAHDRCGSVARRVPDRIAARAPERHCSPARL